MLWKSAAPPRQHQEQFLTSVILTEQRHQHFTIVSIRQILPAWERAVQPRQLLPSVRTFLILPVASPVLSPANPLIPASCRCISQDTAWLRCSVSTTKSLGSGWGLQLPQQQQVKSQSQETQVRREISNCLLPVHSAPADRKAGIKRKSLWWKQTFLPLFSCTASC